MANTNINITAPIMAINRHRITVDGHGITTLIGLHGCPLSCRYCLNDKCHTPQGVWKQLSVQELYNLVKVDDIYFIATGGGITFGGGEPALHSDFITSFRHRCGSAWNITLESSLHVSHSHIAALSRVIDNYIIDIKTLNKKIYRAYTGQEVDCVIENLAYLIAQGLAHKITVRTPLIPHFNTPEDVEHTTCELRQMGIIHFDPFTYKSNVASKKINNDGTYGKAVCNVMKRIRKVIAEANNIDYTPTECHHTTCNAGNCRVCEKELYYLTRQIETKQNNGEVINL